MSNPSPTGKPTHPVTLRAASAANGKAARLPARETVRLAAARVFLEKGVNEATIQDIADEAGMAKGSAYYHIESKETLLFEIFLSGMKAVSREFERIAEYPLSAADRLKLFLFTVLKTAGHDSDLDVALALQVDARFLTPEHRAIYERERLRFQALHERVIRDGIAAGELRPVEDPALLALLLMGQGAHFFRWYNPQSSLTIRQVVDRWWSFMFDGLKPDVQAAN